MNSVNNETDNNLKKLINDNNYTIDFNNYHLTKMIKFLINFIAMYIFVGILLNYNYEFNRQQFILIICLFSSVLLYIVDFNYPLCNVSI
jgi:hypothetical protein